MEIRFTEMDDNNTSNLNNPEKYWENYRDTSTKQKKKKVSFDDILTNMSLTVNRDGALQFMHPLQNNVNDYAEVQTTFEPYQEYVAARVSQKQQQQQKQQPIDPSVKNSFLYNKYFKDYQEAAPPEPLVRVPKTMEEYRQMILQDKISRIREKKRISEIKSTKMMFTTNGVPNVSISSSKNNLKNMNFY